MRPLDVDAGRIVVSGDNATLVLDPDGRQLLSLPISTDAAQLAGQDLVLLLPPELRDYDASSGALLRTWPLDGQQPVEIASSAAALTPLAVDDNRILADREDGTLVLYGAGGTLERSYSLGAPPLAATLGGSDLVVLRPGAVDDLDADTGALRHTWPRSAPDPTLAGVQHGVLAYGSGSDVHLLHLADGNEAVIHAGPNLHAQLTAAGLFYSYTTDDATHPGRVVFVPTGLLP